MTKPAKDFILGRSMTDFYLDLKNENRIIDFLVEFYPYAEAGVAGALASTMEAIETSSEDIALEELQSDARNLAEHVWPMRFAVERYVAQHPEAEWTTIESVLRPETQSHMQRLRKQFRDVHFAALMEKDDVDAALSEEEKLEIADAGREARLALWKEHRGELGDEIQEGESMRDQYLSRFKTLRELAESLPDVLQDEVFSKLDHYEDRVLYAAESVPLEILDDEIAYYREQKEISPLEG